MRQKNTTTTRTVGRENELKLITQCLRLSRNLLIEGPVGVGKTTLALEAAASLGRPLYRIDGDSRYTEQKLTGWFDPPLVIKKGFHKESFIDGPLCLAMRNGGILLLNELNRFPEGVQNILLPALDERKIELPKIGTLVAHSDFGVIATQNPSEFIATHPLGEALLDRFELMLLDYPPEKEENEIVLNYLVSKKSKADATFLTERAVRLVRMTRNDDSIRRGASIRAGISLAGLAAELSKTKTTSEAEFCEAALLALPHRMEFEKNRGEPRERTVVLAKKAYGLESLENTQKKSP